MTITTAKLTRWSGLAALLAGITFAGIQPIHPPDVLASVTTVGWAIITPVKTLMCGLFLLGLTGLYCRQAGRAGWLGLAGFLLFGLSWALNLAFIFAEAFILPRLALASPAFVEGLLGMFNGHPTGLDLGILPAIYGVMGILYMLGGLLFGVATFRAGLLPRWPAALLAVTALVTPAAALLPHAQQRLVGMPVGIALAWLGFALWSEWPARATDARPELASPRLGQSGAD